MKSSLKVCLFLGLTLITPMSICAQSGLGDLLNKIGNRDQSTTTSGSQSITSGIGSAIGGLLGGVLDLNEELTVADLQGTWQYAAPACKFKSENFLKSAGGAIVASQISDKLAPYYEKLGFSASTFGYTFDENGSFTMTFGKVPLKGTVSKAEKEDYFQMEFVKVGSYALATTPVYIEVSGNKMLLLYEIDKFIDLFRSVVGQLGITTLDSIFSLLDEYDGILIGFELTKK